jgi:tetratricopeptide (TPR) repeat protein
MSPEAVSPPSIRRSAQEQRIREELNKVKEDGRSRALLLSGDGGVGKTSLIRRMVQENAADPKTDWLAPIDVDDPHFWLLSNLEKRITDSLGQPGTYFTPYWQELSRIPDYTRENISAETIVSSLGRVKEIFVRCYNQYVRAEKKTVVIIFDTVETIRDTNLLSTLTQWMKSLDKSTLFVLSGRPVAGEGAGEEDPIVAELADQYQGIPVERLNLPRFNFSDSGEYVMDSRVSGGLVGEEKDKLIHLTRGQPLWLAFVVDYLAKNDVPEEMEPSLEYMRAHIPYDGDMTSEGERLYQQFLRRLLAPYRKSDFWHEAIKRLAVARQPIDKTVWKLLMDDLTLPPAATDPDEEWDGVDLDQAWEELTAMPWIRLRDNGRSVTLHDAVAEAFAQRIFPLHDPDQTWREKIWRRAYDIYSRLTAEKEAELEPRIAALEDELVNESSVLDSELIDSSLAVDSLKRELDRLRAVQLYYLFLTNFEQGCELLLTYFDQADQEHDLFIQDLLALYLQRFLPDGAPSAAFNDVTKPKIDGFRYWLTHERPDYYAKIGIMVAAYFIGVARPQDALALLDQLLDRLPIPIAPDLQYRIHILRGNACMRIPSMVREALQHFEIALHVAESLAPEARPNFLAQAHKERGFYFRNIGEWGSADDAYEQAQRTLEDRASASLPTDLNEIASINSNWAYVKGLAGKYNEGINLAEAAITVRRKFGSPIQLGITWSVCGEVYRYARRFEKAWAAYSAAESLLHERPNWNWLGLIYQEQAICLYQALQDGIRLTSDDPMNQARQLITKSLDICQSHSIRAYPSALNRAGRIFGHDDPDRGLEYLADGIVEARRLSDGWFLVANQVEHAELSFRTWFETNDDQYLSQIIEEAPEITASLSSDPTVPRFPDLIGRWELLQGHLALRDYLYRNDADALPTALEHYKAGFPAIADKSLASSGAALVPSAFEDFERLFSKLPPDVRADWQTRLLEGWQGPGEGFTLLRARLQELLARLLR